jgi:3alpha(or 20beta)-hydroxysteroid dehydrogenase
VCLVRIELTSLAQFRTVLDVNLVGAFLGMRAAIPMLRRRGGSVIINVSSIAGIVGAPFTGAYAPSKFGLRGVDEISRA